MVHLEIYVTDKEVAVAYRGQTVSRFTVDRASRQIYRRDFYNEHVSAEELPPIDLETLEVDVITIVQPGEGSVALPNTVRRRATTETIKPRGVKRRGTQRSDQNVDHITEDESSKILRAILESEYRSPNQSKTERAAETVRIAAKLGVGKMAVAGVRANFTRGAYGSPKKLKADFAAKKNKA